VENFGGVKELYDVSLRTNRPIVIGDRRYDINEVVLSFKTAEIA